MNIHQFQIKIYPLKDKLFRFSKRLLEQTEEAEDVVQDVFLRLWNKREKLDEYRSLEALAMVTAKNLCFDRIRSKRSRPEESSEYLDIAGHAVEEPKADYSEEIKMITRAIGKLNSKQRMVIHLRDVEGQEFAEIGRIVGMSENTVRVTLSRARKNVREMINKK